MKKKWQLIVGVLVPFLCRTAQLLIYCNLQLACVGPRSRPFHFLYYHPSSRFLSLFMMAFVCLTTRITSCRLSHKTLPTCRVPNCLVLDKSPVGWGLDSQTTPQPKNRKNSCQPTNKIGLLRAQSLRTLSI